MQPRDADNPIPIGRFARLSGLSVGALRHYDELDLLRPAEVDGITGYRRYRADQLDLARTIRRLRDLEVPIEEIREVLGSDDAADRRRRLGEHERRLQARVDRLVRLLHATRQLQKERVPLMSTPAASTTIDRRDSMDALDEATHRQLGKELFNHTWTLIERADRSTEEVDEMVHAAHASVWHWSRGGGTLANAARGEWQVSRVYATLGRGEPALAHARRALELAEAATTAGVADDWDVAAALEGLARASAIAGDLAAAAEARARARNALEGIADPENRQLIEQDLETAI
jgi:DNA-binding transcriptional MerR regulator